MKHCTECGKGRLKDVDEEQSITVDGRTFVGSVRAPRCAECGATFFDGGGLEAFEEAAAYEIANDGPVSGETSTDAFAESARLQRMRHLARRVERRAGALTGSASGTCPRRT